MEHKVFHARGGGRGRVSRGQAKRENAPRGRGQTSRGQAAPGSKVTIFRNYVLLMKRENGWTQVSSGVSQFYRLMKKDGCVAGVRPFSYEGKNEKFVFPGEGDGPEIYVDAAGHQYELRYIDLPNKLETDSKETTYVPCATGRLNFGGEIALIRGCNARGGCWVPAPADIYFAIRYLRDNPDTPKYGVENAQTGTAGFITQRQDGGEFRFWYEGHDHIRAPILCRSLEL